MESPAWLKRFLADLTTREFVAIKILFFLIYGASMAMFPFLTLQARSLGITVEELGVVYAFNPIIAIVGPPLTGMVADKIGNFKVFLSITMAASGGAALVFSAVPMARRYDPLPDLLPLTVSCDGGGGSPTISLQQPHRCEYLQKVESVQLTVTNCSICGPGSWPRELASAEGLATARPTEGPDNSTQLRFVNWSCPQEQSVNVADGNGTAYDVNGNGRLEEERTCDVQCSATIPREHLCSNTKTTQVFDPMVTFWSYLMVRVLNGLTLATSFTLFDGAAMAILKEHNGEYGLQRLYANLGAIVMTPISGVLIDVFSEISGTQDYRPAFYLYCGLKVFAAIIILFVDLNFRQPSSRVVKDFRSLLKQPETLTFLMVMLISGTCFGLLDTFLFWLLQDLGAKKYLMGITVTVGSLAGVPILVASGYIFKKLGHANTIILGFAVYVIRMMGYSFITNPWWCMPFEALECFTVSLMGAAAVSYAADLSTPATIATLQGVYGGIHYGVGRGVGSLMGGFLMGPLGVRNTFRLMAGVCAVTCVSYFVINHLFFRKLQAERQENARERSKKEEEAAKERRATEGKGHNGVVENGIRGDDRERDAMETDKRLENGMRVAPSGGENVNEAFEKEC